MSARILVTRPMGQAGELIGLLGERGLGGISVPAVEIRAGDPDGPLDRALARLDDADWLVITSVNGAAALLDRLAATRRQLPSTLRVAAVGPATAGTLRAGGVPVHHVPERYLTVAIAQGLGAVAGSRILLARADAATPDLREALLARGAQVEEATAYRTIEGPRSSLPALREALRAPLAGVAFSSGSTVRGLGRLLASLPDELAARAGRLPAFCIGPVTARVARDAGWSVAGVADDHTSHGLAELIANQLPNVEVPTR